MNKTKKKQTYRYREQTSGYQWGEGQYRSRGKKSVIMGLYEIMCVKLLKIVKPIEFKESFIQLKKELIKIKMHDVQSRRNPRAIAVFARKWGGKGPKSECGS